MLSLLFFKFNFLLIFLTATALFSRLMLVCQYLVAVVILDEASGFSVRCTDLSYLGFN